MDQIRLLPGDSLVTFDQRLQRLQLFDPEGVFVRSQRVLTTWPTFTPERMIGVLDGTRVVLQLGGFGTPIPNGVVRWPPELLATADLRTRNLDSVVVVPGTEALVIDRGEGGYSHGTVVFGKDYEFASFGGKVAIIETNTFAVRILEVDEGTERIIHRPVPPEPATEAKVDDLLRSVDGRNGHSVRPPL